MPRGESHTVLRLRSIWLSWIQSWDRFRLRRLMARHEGLDIHPLASSNLAASRFELAPGARLRIGPGVVTERISGGLEFVLKEGAEITIGEGCWLRSELGPVRLIAYENGRIVLERRCWLNACHISAKHEVYIGTNTGIGPGSRVYDSDQHALDDATPEQPESVRIGRHVWVTTDVTILKGVSIGDHCVVGARSVVTRSLPEHSLALGSPAKRVRAIGDRSKIPLLGPE